MTLLRHCTVAAALLFVCASAGPAQTTSGHTFRVFVRGVEVGAEEVTLLDAPDGWTLRGSGKLRPPLNLIVDYWEARYDREWRPLELTLELTENTNKWSVHTTFAGTVASSDITRNGETQRRTNTVSADAPVLPNLVFGAYEALAARLATQSPGGQIQVFIAPQDAVPVTLDSVTSETFEVAGRRIPAQRWTLHVGGGKTPVELAVWVEGTRLLRLDMPAQMVSVVRDDIASVSARLVTLARPNDEQIAIPANGFSLASTVSRPIDAVAPRAGQKPVRLPAVVLLSGSNPSDRDEIVAGIPIFAQLANALADAGYLVVRYDERATGQSGGRAESATLEDFAIDARAVVTYLDRRKDVDPRRIAVVGYGEGGWIAMLVAAAERRVGALALLATPSSSGTELVLEQQQRILGNSGGAQAAVEQQKRILDAVMTGKGWDQIAPDVRRRVDTPLYRSFLTFEPAKVLARVRQPILVVQPSLDQEVPPPNGEQLAQLARGRQRAGSTDVGQLAGANHLLVPADTGAVAEYGTLRERTISADLVSQLTAWLARTIPAATPK